MTVISVLVARIRLHRDRRRNRETMPADACVVKTKVHNKNNAIIVPFSRW
jgi:hypothetical protein